MQDSAIATATGTAYRSALEVIAAAEPDVADAITRTATAAIWFGITTGTSPWPAATASPASTCAASPGRGAPRSWRRPIPSIPGLRRLPAMPSLRRVTSPPLPTPSSLWSPIQIIPMGGPWPKKI